MQFRAEKPEDINSIRQINLAAFGRDNEADLVERLRGVSSTYSFVAIESEQIVAHIFFSPVEIEGKCPNNPFILGLAPIAVFPNYQQRGIGSLLINYALEQCVGLGCKAVVVLGYPEYYSRFGFITAKEKGLRCEYLVPDEAFMVLELESGALEECSGVIKYRKEFGECK